MNSVDHLVITDLADENAHLREALRQVAELVADFAYDLEVAKRFAAQEFRERLRLQRLIDRKYSTSTLSKARTSSAPRRAA